VAVALLPGLGRLVAAAEGAVGDDPEKDIEPKGKGDAGDDDASANKIAIL